LTGVIRCLWGCERGCGRDAKHADVCVRARVRWAGVLNHLSRSVESARALQSHGIMDALLRLVARTRESGPSEAHEAYVGLANMALANIAAALDAGHVSGADDTGAGTREAGKAGSVRFKVSAIKSIAGFLKCALEGQQVCGIRFRVFDVLYALSSLCKCQERDLLGIECGLVDLAVQVTAEWRPGKYSSEFSDGQASRRPVLELSTDILVHLAESHACKQRMHELYLESILDRLLLTAEGRVRDHVLRVLWELRDAFQRKPSHPSGDSRSDLSLDGSYRSEKSGVDGGSGLQERQGDQALYIRALENDARSREEHSEVLNQQLAALGEEVEGLQQSLRELSMEKAMLALDVKDKDAHISHMTQDLLQMQQSVRQRQKRDSPPPTTRRTIHQTSALTRSDAILLGVCAVAALLLLCSCVCALLDNEHCPLLATIDTRMLLAPLLGIQHLPPLPPPTRPDADVTCAKKGWVVGLKAGNEHKKEPPDGGDRAHRGDGRLSTEVVRARIF
jgi:hypothetical protein